MNDADGEVRWREDAHGGFIACRHEGALDGERTRDGKGVGERGDGIGFKDVVDLAEMVVGGCRDMAGQQVGEGEGVDALVEPVGLGEEFPAEEGGVFRDAGGAVFVNGSFESDTGEEVHFERLELYIGIGYCEEDGTGHESARRLGCRAVENEGWRFHVNCHFCRLRRRQFGTVFRAAHAHGDAVALVFAMVFPEDIHDCD